MRPRPRGLLVLLVLTGCASAPDTSVPVQATTTIGPPATTKFVAQDLTAGWEVVGYSDFYEILDVTATDEGYVAVGWTGEDAGVWLSADGIIWESIHQNEESLEESERIGGVAGATFGLVAVSEEGSVVWVSPDGRGWDRIDGALGDGESHEVVLHDIASLGESVVAVGLSKALDSSGMVESTTLGIWTSADGRHWAQVPLDPDRFLIPDEYRFGSFGASVAGSSGNGILVAASYPGLLWSPDGVTWQLLAPELQTLDGVSIVDVASGADGFIIVGDGGQTASVTFAGKNAVWQALGAFDPNLYKGGGLYGSGAIDELAWTGSEWLAGGSSGDGEWVLYRSEDGSAWEQVDVPVLLGVFRALAPGSHGTVAVAEGAIAHSPDNATWGVVAGNEGSPAVGASGFVSVTGTESALFAIGYDIFNSTFEGIWTSPDGRSWQQVEQTPEVGFGKLFAWQGRLYGLASDGVRQSTDGTKWARTADPTRALTGGFVYELAATNTLLVAVGSTGDRGGLWVSNDGETWNPPDQPELFSVPVVAVAANAEGRFLAVGAEGRAAWSSPDGITWTSLDLLDQLPPGWGTTFGLTASDLGWVLVGELNTDTGLSPVALYSADGLTWERAEVNGPDHGGMGDVTTFPGGLAAIGFPGVWVSVDGRVWDPVPVGPKESVIGTDITTWHNQVVGVGVLNNPIIWLRAVGG